MEMTLENKNRIKDLVSALRFSAPMYKEGVGGRGALKSVVTLSPVP